MFIENNGLMWVNASCWSVHASFVSLRLHQRLVEGPLEKWAHQHNSQFILSGIWTPVAKAGNVEHCSCCALCLLLLGDVLWVWWCDGATLLKNFAHGGCWLTSFGENEKWIQTRERPICLDLGKSDNKWFFWCDMNFKQIACDLW